MRKKIVAGNWKMNTTLQEGVALAEGLKEALAGKKVNCDVVVCTPFISVASVAKLVPRIALLTRRAPTQARLLPT